MNYTDWFSNIEPHLYFWDILYLLVMSYFFYVSLDSVLIFVNIFLRIFLSVFIKDPILLFSYNVFG